MKRILFVALAAMMFVACNKEAGSAATQMTDYKKQWVETTALFDAEAVERDGFEAWYNTLTNVEVRNLDAAVDAMNLSYDEVEHWYKNLSDEQQKAAREAAETIFKLRKARLEMITGEQGEGVFGGGLESALREIERLESAYLELFYGVQRVTRIVEYVDMPVSASQTTAVVARFSTERGMVAINDLSGDIVLVDIKPSDMTYPASDEKGKVAYRYANNAEVCVGLSNEVLVSRILPIYEFGATVMYNKPAR